MGTWAICAAGALAPLVFWPRAADVFGVPKLAVISVLVAAAAVSAGRRRSLRLPRVALPAGLYLGAATLATLTSIDRTTSFAGAYERYGGLLPLVLYVLAAATMVLVFSDRPADLWWGVRAVVVGACGLACYVLLQAAGLDVVDWTDEVGGQVRYHAGSMGNSNFAGGYLGISLPLAVALAVRRRPWLVAAAVGGAGLWVTSSRGGLLAAGAGLLALGLAHRGVLLSTRQRRVAAAVAAVVLVVGGGLLASRLTAVSAVGRDPLLRTESAGARLRTWSAAVEMFADRPITGHGPDTFGLLYPEYRSEEDARILGLRITDKPHNLLLEYLVTGGVLLGAAWLFLIGWVGRRVVTAIGRRSGDDKLLLSGLAAALVAYVAQSLVSIDVPPLAFTAWLLVGACVVTVDPPTGVGRGSRWAPRATGLGAVCVAVLASLALVADLRAGRAGRDRDHAAASRSFERAKDLNPFQPAYAVQAAFRAEAAGAGAVEVANRRRQLERALLLYDGVIEEQPLSLPGAVGRARVLTLLARGVDSARFQHANAAWRAALELDPLDWEIRSAYGLMLNAWSNAERGDPAFRRAAQAELQRAVAVNPAFFHGWANLVRIRAALGDRSGAADALGRAEALEPDHAALVELRALVGTLP